MCGGFMAVGVALCVGIALTDKAGNGRALGTIGGFFLWTSVAFFGPGFIGGVGLLRGRSWARTVLIVLSVAVLLAIPVGPVLGGYGLWVLLGKDSKQPPPSESPPDARPPISSAEQQRILEMMVGALGVAALFVVGIGTGYRVTNDPSSPIGNGLYVSAIVVLVAVIVAAVWHFRRPRAIRVQPLTYVSSAPYVPPDPELVKRPEYVALDGHIQELARRIDAPADELPDYAFSHGVGRTHIVIDGETYQYCYNEERRADYDCTSFTSLNELLYRTFRDVTWSMAVDLARPKRKPNTDYRRTTFPEQVGLLERLNPEWARRCAAEHVETLREYPFADGKGP